MPTAKHPAVVLIFVLLAAACARIEKPRPEPSTAGPLTDAGATVEPDAGVNDEEEFAQHFEAQFESDSQLASGEVESFQKPIADALAGLKDAPAVSALECRAKICRASIEVANEEALARVYGALTGRPGPGALRTGRLLPYGLAIARRSTTPHGKLSAQLYFTR